MTGGSEDENNEHLKTQITAHHEIFCLMPLLLKLQKLRLVHSQRCAFANFPLSAYSGAGVGEVTFSTSLGAVVALVPKGGDVVAFVPIGVVGVVVEIAPVIGGAEVVFNPGVVGVGVGVSAGVGVGFGVEPETLVAMVGDVAAGAVVGGNVVAVTAVVIFTASTWMSTTNFPASYLPPPWIVNSVLT